MVFVIFSGRQYEKQQSMKYKQTLLRNFGDENKRKYLNEEKLHFASYAKNKQNEYYLDHLSWNDLNMDEIFSLVNYCKTTAGDKVLYYHLRNPKRNENEIELLERRISYYQEHEEERLSLQVALHKLGYTGKYSVEHDLEELKKVGNLSCAKTYFSYIALIFAVLISVVKIQFGLPILFIVFLSNLMIYFKEKRRIEPYIVCFSYILRALQEITELDKLHLAEFKEELEELKKIQKNFSKFKRFSFLLLSSGRTSGSPLDILLDYLRMFFHLDLLKFHSMYEKVVHSEEEINRILWLIGSMDETLSILEFRAYLKHYCTPSFEKEKYDALNMYHPLIKNPVKNNIQLNKSLLITGSNASGKSTFLKMVAVNAILAQGINTVCADSYHADEFRIFTSLDCKDNIFSGDSFYMSEIKAIKRMIDESKKYTQEGPLLIFVDEVLRGTNTIERIAASCSILKYLSGVRGFCLAATHDIELTELLKDYYENVHFNEEMKDGEIHFPYRLLKGKSTSRNAIALLKVLEYDNDLVKEAEERASIFEKEGKWL